MDKIKTRYFAYTTETGYDFFTHTAPNSGANDAHDHDYIEIIVALDGNMKTTINNKKYTLPPKTIIFLRPFDAHMYNGLAKERHRDFCFTTALFKKVCDFLSENLFNSYMQSPEPFFINISDAEMTNLESMAQTISLGIDIKMKDTHTKIKILLVTLLHLLLKGQYSIEQNNDIAPPPKPIEELLFQLEINSNISDKSLNEILDLLHYNKAYIRRIFKQYTKVDLNKFWLDKKLTRAATLLRTSDLNAQQVSRTCGFESYAYFNKKFIEKFGATPLKFKKRVALPPPYKIQVTTSIFTKFKRAGLSCSFALSTFYSAQFFILTTTQLPRHQLVCRRIDIFLIFL